MESPRIKRILLLVATFADEGGTQKMVCELGNLLAERYEVYECSFDAFNEPHIFRSGNTVLSLDWAAGSGWRQKLTGYYKKAKRLRHLKKQYHIDLTISNLWPADLVNVLSLTKEKKIAISHINVVGNFQNRLLLRFRWFVSFIYNRFDRVVAANKYLREELKELFSLSPAKASFINNFVVLADYQSESVSHVNNRQRLVNCGRLNPIKNHKPLLVAFAAVKKEFPNVQLILVGDGPSKEELLSFAKKLGLRVSYKPQHDMDVVLTGFIHDPNPILCSSDIFVLSSISEGFGLVLVEAMHAGLPIITSDCPTGGPHLIMNGKGTYKPGRIQPEETSYGYLMPVPKEGDEASIKSWKTIIENLLKDEAKQKAMGERARIRSKDFSKQKIKSEWFQLIDAL